MTTCKGCGQSLRAGGSFCPTCGRQTLDGTVSETIIVDPHADQNWNYDPLPPPHRRPVALWVAAAALAVAVVGLGLFVFLPPLAGAPVPVPESTTTGTAAPTTSTQRVPATQQPSVKLAQYVEDDRVAADALLGYWIPQISSKQLGTMADGITFGYPEIVADVETLKARYHGAVVLRSDDYSTFSHDGFWVTVVAERFPTPAQANAWCEGMGFSSDECFAKRLSHSEGPAGNTVHR